MLESQYQKHLIDRLNATFPGCFILLNDAEYMQGIPDLLILFKDRWAILEVKVSAKSSHQPNQDYYVELLNRMSYSAFVYPENEEAIFDDLQQAFRTRRTTRISQR